MDSPPHDPDNIPIALSRTESSDGNGTATPEHLFWRYFAEAKTPKAFCQSWLPLQCRMLDGVCCAMVLLGKADMGPYSPVAVWPDAKLDMHHLTGTAEKALKQRRGILEKVPPDAHPRGTLAESHHVAYPILVSESLHGAVILGVNCRSKKEVQTLMRQLHWGTAWLEVLIRRTRSETENRANRRLQNALDMIVSAVEFERFQACAMALVTRMAAKLGCDRVSIGFASGRCVRVKAMSHTASFGEQTNLVRAIGSAMDEAVDQHSVVVHPPPPDADPVISRAHGELARRHGSGSICTIPLADKGKTFGALSLERPADAPFDADTIELCESVASIAGPVLHTKLQEERWLIRKAAASLARQAARLLGPGYLVRKLVALLIVALAIFFAIFETDYRVTATTIIEGEVQRAVPAPFNGYIETAPIRPGDVVQAGTPLCSLDDRELKLERVKWATQKDQHVKEYEAAMAVHDRAQIRILGAKIAQAEAQLALIDEQLKRARILAPFDGVIVSGDLSQLLGAPVERGQVLFEIAPLDDYRVIAEVDEGDIAEIAVGQESLLYLPSMTDATFPFVIQKITPVSIAREGRNYFRVEGRLTEESQRLRPGMEGVGKITVDRRKLIWIWTHTMMDWLRLQFWKWVP